MNERWTGFFDELEKIGTIPASLRLLIGTALGNELNKEMARKRKRYFEKQGALGVDLRLQGPGGVKRPPFPTEGSKSFSANQFKQSRQVGTTKAPKLTIRSVASLPR